MGSRHWFKSLLGLSPETKVEQAEGSGSLMRTNKSASTQRKRRLETEHHRRLREDSYVPLEVGRLEERRVLNVAPILSGANNLASVAKNVSSASNNGTLVSTIVAGKITDGDAGAKSGVAVTHVDNTHGVWQYSINGGNSGAWQNFGNPNVANAQLLAADANTLIRFVPTAGYSGSASITFQAWDQTTGTAGNTGIAAVNGGTTAFSTANANASILVNDAPVLSGANPFTSIAENATTNGGTLVSALISGQTSDANGNSVGIAVTALDSTHGTWQFSTDGGNSGSWQNFGAVSTNSATLLTAAAGTYIRFVPNTNFIGTVSPAITFQAWDQTSGAEGSSADATTSGGSTAFSSASASSAITVDTPPTITGAMAGQTTTDDTSKTPFSGVTIGDTATTNPTLTVIVTLDNAANGQFIAGSTTGWTVDVAAGTYSFSGDAAAATTALQGLVFAPTNHKVAPGGTVTTTFTISADDSVAPAVTNNTTTVIATAVNNAPTISGAAANQAVNDNATISPFSGVTISDSDLSSEPASITVTLDNAANGRFTPGSLSGWTSNVAGSTYSYSGTRAQVEAAVQGLVFAPTNHQVLPGSTVTTAFTLALSDGTNSASDNTTSVVATAINNPPTIVGATAGQTVNDNATRSPFSGVTFSDADIATEPASVTVTLDQPANGQFTSASTSAAGWTTVDTAGGIYTFSGTRAQAQAALQGLVFTPTNHQVNPGSTVTTQFTIDLTDGANSASNSATTVIATAVNNPPTIVGATANQAINDNATISPFSGVTISDADLSSEPATITITLSQAANGRFSSASTSAAGWTTVNTATGVYTFTGTRAEAEAALQGLVFAPTNHQVVPGSTVTTQFTIALTDGSNSTSNNTTTVVATAVNNPPTISGTVANQAVNDNATIKPFSGATISDPDNASEPVTFTIALDTPANGQFTSATTNPANGWTTVNVAGGIYTFTGTRAAAQTALAALVFVPTAHEGVPGSTFTTTFVLQLTDGANSASDNTTSVVATAVNNPPTIQGTVANQAVNDNATLKPFNGVTFADPDDSAEPVSFTVTIDHPLNGHFTPASVSGAGWTANPVLGTYTFSGTRAQAQTAIDGMVFQPGFALGPPGSSTTTHFTIALTDGANSANDSTTSVIATATNSAPVLSGGNDFTAILQNPTTNNGNLVSDLVAGQISNANGQSPEGIAVTLVDNTQGTWQYSTTSGATWLPFVVLGDGPSDTQARLLAANPQTRVRFVPSQPGVVSNSFQFRAWDQFTGVNGGTADTTSNGGSTAFSTAKAFSNILVNDAPVLTGANDLAPITENPISNPGTLVSALVAGKSSDVNGNSLGVAVTAADNTNGIWQFSTDGGTNWNAIGSPSQSAALLLTPSTLVRFAPNTNFFATVSPGLTFRAWDRVTGSAGAMVDLTVANSTGGTTSYSTGQFSSAILVEAPPTISGATTTNINDQQTTHPFGGVTIGDPNAPAEMFTVTFTESATANGVLSNLGGFTTAGGGVYTLSGTAAAATTALNGIVFTPTLHQATPGNAVTTDFSLTVSDPVVSATDANTHVVVAASNTAPTLAGASNFPAIQQNPTSNNGVLVSTLIAGNVSDPDIGQTEGIAITQADNTSGVWQFSIDGGGSWNAVGAVSDTQALLLTGNANTRVRFVPNGVFSGLVSPGISFRAWDGFTGSPTGIADTTTNGGSTAFSTAHASSSILVNDAPVLSGANNLTTIVENPPSNVGTAVSALIAGQATDPNGNPLGIAVTAVNNTNGVWQYSTDSGANWTNFGSVSANSARLLSADVTTFVRFVPNNNFFGLVSPGITFSAWDHSTGSAGGTADLTAVGSTGGTAAFSTASASAAIRVNAPPTITGAVAGQTTGDNASIQPFAAVTVGDQNTPAETLTVTVVIGNPANGQFTAASLAGWSTVTPGSIYSFSGTAPASTLALRSLVFVPTLHQVVVGSSVTTGFTIAAGNGINPAISDSTTTIVATAVNDAPTLNSTTGGALITITESPATNNGDTIATLAGTLIGDVDLNPLKGIAIIGTTVGASPTGGNGSGFWEYSTNSGATWTAIGGVSSTGALLLRGTDLVRFHPDGNNGNTATITYRAWDQTAPTAGQQGSKINVGAGGGVSPFSATSATSQAIATDVNSAPTFISATQTILVPANSPQMTAGNANGTIFGQTFTVGEVDTVKSIAYSIDPASNPGGTFKIDPTTGVLSVADATKLNYSPAPISLTIIATEHQFDAISAAAPQTQTAVVRLWQFTAAASNIKLRSTTLSYSLSYPGTQGFPGRVTWDTGVTDNITAAPGLAAPQTIGHFFATTPQRSSAAAPIPIVITVTDPQGHTATFLAQAAVPATGLGAVATPQITPPSRISLPPQTVPDPPQAIATVESASEQISDGGVGGGEASSTDQRKIVLRLVDPLGVESSGKDIPLPEDSLANLPGLFKRLPDGHYRVYLSENGKDRIVIDVVVRQGRAVDPTDESSGTADRPPTSQIEIGNPLPIAESAPVTDPAIAAPRDSGGSQRTAAAPKARVDRASDQNLQQGEPDKSPASQLREETAAPLDRGAKSADWSRWRAVVAAATGAAAGVVLSREEKTDLALQRFEGRSVSKAVRRARRLKK